MRTSIILKDEIYQEASKATGVKQVTALIHLGLEELIQKSRRKRLAALAGSSPTSKVPRRRR